MPVAQNIGTRAFWVRQVNTSKLALYWWDEAATTPLSREIDISTIPTDSWVTNTPDQDWLAKRAPGENVTAATLTGSDLWVGWSAARRIKLTDGTTRAFLDAPHIEIARIDVNRLRLLDQRYIWNPDYAFQYPSFATNDQGEVGIAFEWGGIGGRWANGGVGFLTGRFTLVNVTSGNSGMQGGDYTTIRRHEPFRGCFSAITPTQVKDAAGNRANHPEWVLFGRRGTRCELVLARPVVVSLPVSPPPPPPATSSMTLSCPGTTPSGTDLAVGGSLTPARAGAGVTVRYTPPGATPIAHSVTTAANGAWSDSVPTTGQPTGTWAVDANHDADAATTASSAGCTTTVTSGGSG
jgi:hypothetical protein